ncbi:MAG: undecaprenyldiphospho-muramoylpentapeptide beta-N-acetylglucosaminyltransferase [Micavibrio sp.]|nr:undecaprenyldiphospho-muramoylpentapeptide beta-N-acetylglucosaminyltransferase [Micavibrio sp.]|tara:strand:- start:6984 stop:8090 length:1107 start_codon:yes stop_codon:yes gene_type:complete
MSEQPPLIILSAGGTGGHMTPARALGHDLLSRGFRVEVITDTRGERFSSIFEGMPMHVVKAGTLGKGIMGKVKGLGNLGLGILKAGKILRRMKPVVVVGFGGYPSVPAVYAAQKMGIPTIIHEANAIMGRANDMLAARAERIALSLPDVAGLEQSERIRSIITGNPVRPDIAALYTRPYPTPKPGGELRILIFGGSLGATILSKVVPEAISMLSSEHRARLHIVQQCRAEDIDAVREMYKTAGVTASLKTFFDDVPEQLAQAHLVIARSGASTVAEVTVAGRPAIFVPMALHQDNQQKMNADSVADAGGAWVMAENGFTPDALLARLETFLQNPQTLFKAAENARSCGKPDAARKLGNLVTAIASGWN